MNERMNFRSVYCMSKKSDPFYIVTYYKISQEFLDRQYTLYLCVMFVSVLNGVALLHLRLGVLDHHPGQRRRGQPEGWKL